MQLAEILGVHLKAMAVHSNHKESGAKKNKLLDYLADFHTRHSHFPGLRYTDAPDLIEMLVEELANPFIVCEHDLGSRYS